MRGGVMKVMPFEVREKALKEEEAPREPCAYLGLNR